MHFPICKLEKGFLMIEILIVVAILIIILTSLSELVFFSLRNTILTKETFQANAIAQEAIEVARNIRDNDWNKITNGSHGLTNTLGYWDFEGTENMINGFRRTIIIENVSRNQITDDIEEVYNPSNDDSGTKKVTVTVSWKNKEVKIVTYLTNWK